MEREHANYAELASGDDDQITVTKENEQEDDDEDAQDTPFHTIGAGSGHFLHIYTQILASCQCFFSLRMLGTRTGYPSSSGAAGLDHTTLVADAASDSASVSASILDPRPSLLLLLLLQHDTLLSWARRATSQATMFSSWLNGLLFFVPIGLWAFLTDKPPLVVFAANGVAIVPLSSLLTGATEMIAEDAGDTVGALLNITLGNLVELILFVALKHKQVHVVQASILGSMLVNLLPILGTALCVNGLRQEDPVLNVVETQLLSCLLLVSVFVLLVPAAFNSTFDGAEGASSAMLRMSRASAIVVLLIYVLYFVHELSAHTAPSSYDPPMSDIERCPPAFQRTILLDPPALSSRTIRFVDEESRRQNRATAGDGLAQIELGNIDASTSNLASDDDDETSEALRRGRKAQKLSSCSSRSSSCDDVVCSRNHSLSRSRSVTASTRGRRSRDHSTVSTDRHSLLRPPGLAGLRILRSGGTSLGNPDIERATPRRSNGEKALSILVLMISSALMSMCAEFLVGTIDEVTHQGHLSESFIGLIILPVVGNVAEFVTVVTVAHRDKIDLAVAVAVGSSVQIALCVAPLTIIAAWIMRRGLSLSFSLFEATALVGAAVLVIFFFLSDGSSVLRMSRFKGALMCACYVIVG
ncbi:Putative calcium/proton exchanger, sodium/calcium exchanger membrane region [Colletotrichum destructivum]|uniref:Calcium/proton exchanger, sodium/calcium exchanger membrane region n=1 Tax=Colletotrichum destructivum TaxID=34406 RepID=A0AAX4HZY5_9PEZI|nr:Putative calcium/proton exchanger, sodium/calcium exchanger membrane region [Colletotrichum destructivum]